MRISKQKVEIQQARSGLSSAQIANLCNTSVQVISRVLKKGACNPVTLGKIARALGVDPADIIEEE